MGKKRQSGVWLERSAYKLTVKVEDTDSMTTYRRLGPLETVRSYSTQIQDRRITPAATAGPDPEIARSQNLLCSLGIGLLWLRSPTPLGGA